MDLFWIKETLHPESITTAHTSTVNTYGKYILWLDLTSYSIAYLYLLDYLAAFL